MKLPVNVLFSKRLPLAALAAFAACALPAAAAQWPDKPIRVILSVPAGATPDVEPLTCPICWSEQKEVAFGCGHMLCEGCSLLVADCPICRKDVSLRLRVYVS